MPRAKKSARPYPQRLVGARTRQTQTSRGRASSSPPPPNKSPRRPLSSHSEHSKHSNRHSKGSEHSSKGSIHLFKNSLSPSGRVPAHHPANDNYESGDTEFAEPDKPAAPSSSKSFETPFENTARSAVLPVATPAPSISARSGDRRIKGAIRSHPCLGCVRSALSGKSPSGLCHDNASSKKGKRCYCCAGGKSCVEVPLSFRYVTDAFMQAYADGRNSTKIDRYRTAVRVLLELRGEKGEELLSDSHDEDARGGAKRETTRKILITLATNVAELTQELGF